MPKYSFETCCPVCLDTEHKYCWEHSEDEGSIDIWDNCDLQCDYCGEKDFILYWYFNCQTSKHNAYKKIKKIQTIAAISQIASCEGLTSKVKMKMLNILYNSK